jgi:hypothetical protein
MISSEMALARESKRIARAQRRAERISERQKKRLERHKLREQQKQLREEIERDRAEHEQERRKEEAQRQAILKKEKKFRAYRRKKLLKFYIRVCFSSTVLGIKTLNPANIPILLAYIRNNKTVIREFTTIFIHSTVFFVSAYLLVFLIKMLTSAISGLFFEYSSILYHYEVFWMVKPEEWFGDSVKLIYASGPIIALILAVFFAIFFSYIQTDRNLSKLFILWFFMHAFNAFFGALLIGSLFGRGFGYAIIWSYISDTEKVIYSIISITALFLLGVFTSRSFLISANTYFTKLEKNRQRAFIWAQAILPFLFGNILIGLIMYPRILLYDMTVSLTLFIAIIPIAIGHRFSRSLYFDEEPVKIYYRPLPLILIPLLIIFYRVILGFGIIIGQ